MAIPIQTGKIETAKKVVIYGPEGIGKSTLASKFPRPIFIDCEGSTNELDVSRYPAPLTWNEILAFIDDAVENHTCDTLIIDTADWCEQFCTNYTCDKLNVKNIEDIGYGKGYQYLTQNFTELLKRCDVLITNGINVVFTAHAQMRKFEQPDEMGAYDRWEMKLSKRNAPLLKEWADLVLFCNYKTTVITDQKSNSKKATGGTRKMFTTHHPCWDAKNRYGLPEVMDMDFEGIAHLFKGPAVVHSPAPEDKNLDWTDGITKKEKLPKVKTKTSDPREFELAMLVNGLTMEQVQAFSEAKGNFPGIDPLNYPQKYKDALMQLDNIERIKKYVKENENG
jgi:hypothetical protein